MESRTRWRKDEPGLRKRVQALVEALREGVGAQWAALFDDDRAQFETDPSSLSLWDALAELACVASGWRETYAQLREVGHFEHACTCGAHRISGFLIHERWVLLLVTPRNLDSGSALVLASGLRGLAQHLPPARAPDPVADRHREPPGRTVSGAPLWWVRRPRQ